MWIDTLKNALQAPFYRKTRNRLASALARLAAAEQQHQDLLERLRASAASEADQLAQLTEASNRIQDFTGWLREAEARAASQDSLRRDAERVAAERFERLVLLEKAMSELGGRAALDLVDQPNSKLEGFLQEHGLSGLAATVKWRRLAEEPALTPPASGGG